MRILFYKLGGIGDVVDSAVLCAGIRKQYPDAAITAVVRDKSQVPLMLACREIMTGKPVADVVAPLPTRRLLWQRYQMDWRAGWEHFTRDADWDLAYDARPYWGRVFSFRRGIPSVRGHHSPADEMTYQNPLSVWTHKLASRGKTVVELLAESMGIKASWSDCVLPTGKLPLGEGWPKGAVILSNAADGRRRQTKQWSEKRFGEIAAWLKEQGKRPIQLGLKRDKRIPNCIDLRGKTSLLQAVEIVRFAELVVSIEGGLARIAGLVDTPSVVLFLSTPASLFRVPSSVAIEQVGCPLRHGCMWLTGEWMHECPKGTTMRVGKEKPMPFCGAWLKTDTVINAISKVMECD